MKLPLWFFFLVLVSSLVSAASTTQTVNLSIDNQTVRVAFPAGTYETTCGQQLTHPINITYTYDQTVIVNSTLNTTINTTILNPGNCTVVYNFSISDSNFSNSSSWEMMMRELNSTRYSCQQAKATCYDLYNGNITYSMNITGDDIIANITASSRAYMDYFVNEIKPQKLLCDNYKTEMDRCTNTLLPRCYDEKNITEVTLKTEQETKGMYRVVCVISFAAIVVMLLFLLGRQYFQRTGKGPVPTDAPAPKQEASNGNA